MWVKQFSKVYQNIQKQSIWRAWADVNNWPKWDNELEYCELKGQFIQGEQFILKSRGGPKLIDEPDDLKITNTITVTGPLAFLWAHLVAKKVAQTVPLQTERLVEFARANL